MLIFGDSLSAGYGLPQEAAWPHLLEQRLRAVRGDYKVANASISGETTLGGSRRIGAALKTHRPSIVVLALGANDGLRGHSLAAMRENLAAIVDASRKADARVLLVGMRLPPNYGKDYTEKFHAVFLELAERKRIPLVPFLLEGFAENRDWFQADGLHPTAQAQPVMRDTVWKGLQPLLRPAAAQKPRAELSRLQPTG